MKRTRKFIAAESIARKIGGLRIDENIYSTLEEHNYFWNSEDREWVKGEDPDPPTNLVRIRVWADKEQVEEDAINCIQRLQQSGYVLEEKSDIYLCRPPKQLEARIYLTFSRG